MRSCTTLGGGRVKSRKREKKRLFLMNKERRLEVMAERHSLLGERGFVIL